MGDRPGTGPVVVFDYAKDQGARCPFPSHARKTNPRDVGDGPHAIARRGFSYGPATLEPKADEEVGLLFLCAQSSIEDGFEFQQTIWSNAANFPQSGVGLDPLIGQWKDGTPARQRWPKSFNSTESMLHAHTCLDVWLRGAEYFLRAEPELAARSRRRMSEPTTV